MARAKREVIVDMAAEAPVDPEVVFDESSVEPATADVPVDELIAVNGVDYVAEDVPDALVKVAARLNGDIYCVEW